MSIPKNKSRRRNNELRETVRIGSGNVFADLDLPNADERLSKAGLAHEICVLIASANLTQAQAARRLGIDQPKVSALMRGRLEGFSTDRLLRFITALGRDVLIVIRPAEHQRQASVRVVAQA